MYELLTAIYPFMGRRRQQKIREILTFIEENPLGPRKHSADTRRKISESLRGRAPGFRGKSHTEESKARMADKARENQRRAKPFIAVAPDGTVHRGENLAAFCRGVGLKPKSATDARCSGTSLFGWRFLKEKQHAA